MDDATTLVRDILSTGLAEENIFNRYVLAGYCIGDAQRCDSLLAKQVVDNLMRTGFRNGVDNDDVYSALAAIAADFVERPSTVGEVLSHELIGLMVDQEAPKHRRLQAIAVLGRAKISQAVPHLLELLRDSDKEINQESIKALISFGNL